MRMTRHTSPVSIPPIRHVRAVRITISIRLDERVSSSQRLAERGGCGVSGMNGRRLHDHGTGASVRVNTRMRWRSRRAWMMIGFMLLFASSMSAGRTWNAATLDPPPETLRPRTTSEGGAAIHRAAEHGDVRAIAAELARGVTIDLRLVHDDLRKRDTTPLHLAIGWADVATVRFLLDRGADPAARTGIGSTPLIWAAFFGDAAMCRLLLERGASAKDVNDEGTTALIGAAAYGDLERVNLLLEAGADLHARDHHGGDALFYAAGLGDPARVRRLLDAGGRFDHFDAWRMNALMRAAWAGRWENIAVLLEYGAEVNARNERGATALHAAITGDHAEIIRRLARAGAEIHVSDASGVPLVAFAAARGAVNGLRALLELGADVEARDNDDRTALFHAARAGEEAACRVLLEAGASVDRATRAGHTALMAAAWSGHVNVARLLADKGADLHKRDHRWYTLPMWAAFAPDGEVMRWLLAQPIEWELDAISRSGWTALTLAAAKGNEQAVEALLTYRGRGKWVDPEQTSGDGMTAWLWAAKTGDVATLEQLAQARVNERATTSAGFTALDLALQRPADDPHGEAVVSWLEARAIR